MALSIVNAPSRTTNKNVSSEETLTPVHAKRSGAAPLLAGSATPATMAPLKPKFVVETATVTHTFSEAAQSLGVNAQITQKLADAFSARVDLRQELEPGDRLSLVFDESKKDDNDLGSELSQPVAAKISLGAVSHEIFLFTPVGGRSLYYSRDGMPTKLSFSRYPVTFTRVSSPFSAHRLDPVTHRWQSHDGIDLAAPIGTPVHATANGVVKFAGSRTGYGKIIILSNRPPYSTRFAHLSRFAEGIKQGSRVRRNQVIGYVGKTGWATGPHLHFEVRIDHVASDPLTVTLPEHHRLQGTDHRNFAKQIKEQMALL